MEGKKTEPEYVPFITTIEDIQRLSRQADKTINFMIRTEENGFFGKIIKSAL